MTGIPSAIQVPTFLDKDKMDEVEAVTKDLDDDEHKALEIILMEDDHIWIFLS
jgi:hypothetical protein